MKKFYFENLKNRLKEFISMLKLFKGKNNIQPFSQSKEQKIISHHLFKDQ